MALSDLKFEMGLAFEAYIWKQFGVPVNHFDGSKLREFILWQRFPDPGFVSTVSPLVSFCNLALEVTPPVSKSPVCKIGLSSSVCPQKKLDLPS